MEIHPDCTVSPRRRLRDALFLALLTLGVLLVHGYHPWAEDGGIYLPRVEYTLSPTLFPHDSAFVSTPLPPSVFALVVALLARVSHLPLGGVVLCLYLFTAALTLFAALRVAERCFATRAAQWTGVALLAASWTVPVAGTSLLLMDPYLTARSFSTPFSLLALSAALAPWPALRFTRHQNRRKLQEAWMCAFGLVLAAMFHLLMALYAVGTVLTIRLLRARVRVRVWGGLLMVLLLAAVLVQACTPQEAPAQLAADYSRQYWFLSQWRWFEYLGLIGPAAFFTALLRWRRHTLTAAAQLLCKACLVLAVVSSGLALCFTLRHLPAYPVARLQPLRTFHLLYAVLILLLGGSLASGLQRTPLAAQASVPSPWLRRRLGMGLVVSVALIMFLMFLMFLVERRSFPKSAHIEVQASKSPNAWVQAFVWARNHTASNAVFALDAMYIAAPGEDAQGFRAIAERSALPDFVKDGGEAANAAALAPAWQQAVFATQQLSAMSDGERERRLQPFAIEWLVLEAHAGTARPCPYMNTVVKICRL